MQGLAEPQKWKLTISHTDFHTNWEFWSYVRAVEPLCWFISFPCMTCFTIYRYWMLTTLQIWRLWVRFSLHSQIKPLAFPSEQTLILCSLLPGSRKISCEKCHHTFSTRYRKKKSLTAFSISFLQQSSEVLMIQESLPRSHDTVDSSWSKRQDIGSLWHSINAKPQLVILSNPCWRGTR